MKRLFYYLIYIGSFFAHKSLAEIPKSSLPNWVQDNSFSSINLNNNGQTNGINYLLIDQQTNIVQQCQYVKLVYAIKNETGLQYGGQFFKDFDPSYQRLEFISLNVYRENKKINKLSTESVLFLQREKDAERYLYDGNKTANINFHDIQINDLVEISYKVTGFNLNTKSKYSDIFYLDGSYDVAKIYTSVIFDKKEPVYSKMINTNLKPQELDLSNGLKKLFIEINQPTKAVEVQDQIPQWYSPFAEWQISQFTSWKDVQLWANKLFDIKESPSKEMVNLVSRLKDETGNDQNALLTKLIRFVKNDIRYVGEMNGIHNYKPHSPNKILSQKFGDCKDKSLLLCKLFSLAGFQAYPVLVSNSKRATVGNVLPMNQAFDHCIVKAIYGNKATYIDPTIKNQGNIFAHIYTPNYGLGLVLFDDSDKLQIIPPKLNSQINIREEFEINSFEIPGRLYTEIKFSGYEADIYRNILNTLNKQDLNKTFTHFYAEAYSGYSLVSEPIISDNLYDNLLYITMNATVASFFKSYDKTDTNKLKFEIAPLQIISSIPTVKDLKRTMPIGIEHPTQVEYNINVLLPTTWETIPDQMTILSEYFNYTSKAEGIDNSIHLSYNYSTLKNYVPAENSDLFIEDLEKMRNNLGYTLYYQNGSTQNNTTSEINIIRILVFSIAILISAILVFFLHKYDPKPSSNVSLPLSRTMVGFWILLIIGFLYRIINIFFEGEYFSNSADQNLLTFDYGKKLSLLISFELLIETIDCILTFFIIIWYYQRRTLIPAIISANYLFLLFWRFFEIFYMQYFKIPFQDDTYTFFIQILFSILIIIFFRFSDKVSWTFTNTLSKDQVPNSM